MTSSIRNQTHILGCKIDLASKENILSNLDRWTSQGGLHQIVTLNPEMCLYADKDPYYKQMLNRTDLTVADGFGLKIARVLLSGKRFPRITGTSLVNSLCYLAAKKRLNVFLLGADMGIAKKAAERLKKKFPNLNIVGATPGISPQNFTLDTPRLVKKINHSKAHILLVAFGHPKQEQWIDAHKNDLKSVKIAVGVGGVFDYLAGKVQKPPKWVRKIGLEWLFRLITQPARYKRIFKATVVFPLIVLIWRVRLMTTYRKNVVAMIINKQGRVLVASPWWSKHKQWQFPQGGVDKREKPEKAIIREMKEELGTDKFKILDRKNNAHRYQWEKPHQLIRGYKGQKQDLFILKFIGKDTDMDVASHGELTDWKWVKIENLISELAPPRKALGRIALKFYKQHSAR